jgi:predicted nuclease of predicted toxin-antitoxin system
MGVLADEHVPSVVITTLRSNGHDVVEANDVFGESTDDEPLLRYAGENDLMLVTHDRDFAGRLSRTVDLAGVVVYTDANYLRDEPEDAVRTLERVLAQYPPAELRNELVWLDQWR